MLINWGEGVVSKKFEEMGAIEQHIQFAIQGAKENSNPELGEFAKLMADEFGIAYDEGVI